MPVGGMGMGGMFGGGGAGLNTLLNQMDSLGDHVEDRWTGSRSCAGSASSAARCQQKPLVFVIGATNRPEVLDPALTRPGPARPDARGLRARRRGPARHHQPLPRNRRPTTRTSRSTCMVADSIGWTPVMIKTIINEALIIAHDDGRDYLTYKDWLGGGRRAHAGPQAADPRRVLTEDRRATAYHEAGHAVVAHYLKPGGPDPQGLDHPARRRPRRRPAERQGGAPARARPPDRDRHHGRRCGSRAVEEIFLDTKMTGASSDLMGASSAALAYCADFGMGSTLLVMPSSGNRVATRCRSPAWPSRCSRRS